MLAVIVQEWNSVVFGFVFKLVETRSVETKLAESDKEKLLDELNPDHEASEQAKISASRRKIQETVEAEEIDEEKWTKLKGRSIVSACRFCQGDVNIMENVLSRNGLGSCGLYDAKMKAAYPKALIQPPSQEICTCSC